MKYLFKKLIVIVVIILISSCKNKEIKHDSDVIDITDVYLEEPKKIKLSEIASNINYIPLQTDSTSILGNINTRDVKFFGEKILIKDNTNNLLLFNNTGEFLSKIGRIGRGPGEYLKIKDFTILPKDSLIVINSLIDKKFLFYNYKGEYIKGYDNNIQSQYIYSINNHLVSVNSFLFRKASDFYNINVFTKKGTINKQLLHKPHEETLSNENGGRVNWGFKTRLRSAYILNGRQFYYEQGLYDSKDTIWEITKDFKTKLKHIIFFGGNKPPLEGYYKDIKFSNRTKVYSSIQGFIETNNYMFMVAVIPKLGRIQYIYRDKQIQKNVSIRFDNPIKPGYNFSFYNNIDGGMPFWPKGLVSDNKVFKLIYGHELKDFLLKTKKNKDFNNKESRKKISNMIRSSKVTDNPILMIVTLK